MNLKAGMWVTWWGWGTPWDHQCCYTGLRPALSTTTTNSKNLLGYCWKVEKTDWRNKECKCWVQKGGMCTTQYQSELGFKACPFHLPSQQVLTLSNTKDADKEALIPAKRGIKLSYRKLGSSTVAIYFKPQIRAVLENPGHSMAGNIHKQPWVQDDGIQPGHRCAGRMQLATCINSRAPITHSLQGLWAQQSKIIERKVFIWNWKPSLPHLKECYLATWLPKEASLMLSLIPSLSLPHLSRASNLGQIFQTFPDTQHASFPSSLSPTEVKEKFISVGCPERLLIVGGKHSEL